MAVLATGALCLMLRRFLSFFFSFLHFLLILWLWGLAIRHDSISRSKVILRRANQVLESYMQLFEQPVAVGRRGAMPVSPSVSSSHWFNNRRSVGGSKCASKRGSVGDKA